jgi:hypothetical protein
MTLKSKLDHANKRVEKMETELRGDKDEPKKEDGKSPNSPWERSTLPLGTFLQEIIKLLLLLRNF